MRPLIVLLLALVGGANVVNAQTVMPSPYQTFLNNAGAILPSGCIWTYTAGTTTAATTYTDNTINPSSANTNPIIADSAGRFVAFLVAGNAYKFVYEATPCSSISHGSVIKTVDNISTVPSGSVNIDVTGTAGEAINAGAVVYLSDGSGSKVAGSWYNTATGNTYSSNLATMVGIAPSAISSGASGTIRIAGRVTGLTGLTIGAPHYVAAGAGALTATAPTNARYVGTADSATSIVLTPDPAQTEILQRQIRINAATPYTWTFPSADASGFLSSNGSGTLALSAITQPLSVAEGRLTGTTATPVTTSDVTGVASIFYTPYRGNRIALYDGSTWNVRTFTEITISVAACTASKPYDVFVVDAGAGIQPTAEILVWTSTTARATALTTQDGVLVKTGALTRRYIGTFYCNASGAQTDDSFAKRYIWNYYNRVPRAMRVTESTASWNYTVATYRQANAAVANQLDFVIGVAEESVWAEVICQINNTGGAVTMLISIGVDSTTTPDTTTMMGNYRTPTADSQDNLYPEIITFPAIGRHTLVWLEKGGAGGVFTSTNNGGLAGIFGVING